jgi:hypothetical protein
MKLLLLGLSSVLFLSACAVPDPYPVYVDRPVVVHHHRQTDDSFQAVEKPSSYSSKRGED